MRIAGLDCFADDRPIVIPERIKKMSREEIDKEIERLWAEREERLKKKKNSTT